MINSNIISTVSLKSPKSILDIHLCETTEQLETLVDYDVLKLIKKFVEEIRKNPDLNNLLLKITGENLCLADSSDFKSDNLVIYPGSFGPLHNGHIRILEGCLVKLNNIIEDKFSFDTIFEISLSNLDKNSPNINGLIKRISQFNKDYNIPCQSFQYNTNNMSSTFVNSINNCSFNRLSEKTNGNFFLSLTNAGKFIEKLECFKNYTKNKTIYFTLGADTYIRLFNLKYYKTQSDLNHDSDRIMAIKSLLSTLIEFEKKNVHFLIAGREVEKTIYFKTDPFVIGKFESIYNSFEGKGIDKKSVKYSSSDIIEESIDFICKTIEEIKFRRNNSSFENFLIDDDLMTNNVIIKKIKDLCIPLDFEYEVRISSTDLRYFVNNKEFNAKNLFF